VALSRFGRSAFGHTGHPSNASPTTVAGQPAGQGTPTLPPALDGAAAQPAATHVYGTVISGGRVIDPASGFDGAAHVGIDGGTITAVSTQPLHGAKTIDATGKVVSPGFIDFLSYEPNTNGAHFKIGDGVTTNLGMHGMQNGVFATQFFDAYRGQCPVNFGGAFSDHWVRYQKLGLNVGDSASPDQISSLADTFEQELHNGWLGIDFEPEYTPGVQFDEIKALAQVAQKHGVPCFFHGRYSSHSQEHLTVPEIIRVAKETGASVHVAHLPSTGGTWDIQSALEQIHQARAEHYDVTACMYPYSYWATYLGSARFTTGDWQTNFQISYNDLQIAGTSERLTAATFPGYQAQNKLAVAYAIPESSVVAALKDPMVMIGSDAIVDGTNNHPRASGCFSRVLGRYVREQHLISLPEALAKMTILPARRLEAKSPALRKKGRLQRGADADITVFDPHTVADTSTVENPAAYSAGIEWVLLGGQVVKDRSGVIEGVNAGQPIMSSV